MTMLHHFMLTKLAFAELRTAEPGVRLFANHYTIRLDALRKSFIYCFTYVKNDHMRPKLPLLTSHRRFGSLLLVAEEGHVSYY